MKKIMLVLLLMIMCVSVSGCAWIKCIGCPPGDPNQRQVVDPCWECWKATEEKRIKGEYKKLHKYNNDRIRENFKEVIE